MGTHTAGKQGGGKDQYLQFLRGVALGAVVLIHVLATCFEYADLIVVRPFLNFSVALFVFLSGYLTPAAKCADLRGFYSRRVGKILWPYLLWSFFYLAVSHRLQPLTVCKALLIGGSSAQLYYLVVYLQLVLLTPLLHRWLARGGAPRIALWCVTPLCLVVRYALTFAGLPSANIRAFCGTWLAYYLFGLEWKDRFAPWLQRHGVGIRRLALLVAAGICLQWLEGVAWHMWGNDELAITHMRFSALFTSLVLAAWLMSFSERGRSRLAACRPLVVLGDLSFGVYLCHMAAIKLWAHFLPAAGLWSVPMFLAVLVASAVGVAVCKRLLPRRVCGWLGF